MENKENRPRLKISIFDVVIIAVVIIAAGALIFVWRLSGKSSGAAIITKPIHYAIELNGMAAGTADKIKEGDIIMDSKKKFIMGTVESVSVLPATTPEKNLETGDTIQSQVPDKETALIELITEVSSSDSEIKAASGYIIRVGEEVQATGPGYAGLGYVVTVDREDLN